MTTLRILIRCSNRTPNAIRAAVRRAVQLVDRNPIAKRWERTLTNGAGEIMGTVGVYHCEQHREGEGDADSV